MRWLARKTGLGCWCCGEWRCRRILWYRWTRVYRKDRTRGYYNRTWCRACKLDVCPIDSCNIDLLNERIERDDGVRYLLDDLTDSELPTPPRAEGISPDSPERPQAASESP